MKYPLKTIPALKDYLWGGIRLKEEYGKRSPLDIVAESWEISCHPDGPSTVENGPLAGGTLAQVLAERPDWMGTACRGMTEFPLLLKLIDAAQDLSVQVHPDDDYARRVEHQQGKNEMWYVVDAAPGAKLALGLSRPLSRSELAAKIGDNTMMDEIRWTPVRPGDCYCVPAGMLHAIGAGCLIAEVQQNSNVTYRVCDYGRLGPDGKPRALHVDRALDVVDSRLRADNQSHSPAEEKEGCAVTPLANWPYFHASLLEVKGRAALNATGESFHCLMAVSGALTLHGSGDPVSLPAGSSAFAPAGMGDYTLTGSGKALLVHR